MLAHLPPRTIHAYRRLAKLLAALIKTTHAKPAGPVGPTTIATANRVIAAANAVFSREADISRLPLLPVNGPLTLLDLILVVNELQVAAQRFEEQHPEIDLPGMDFRP